MELGSWVAGDVWCVGVRGVCGVRVWGGVGGSGVCAVVCAERGWRRGLGSLWNVVRVWGGWMGRWLDGWVHSWDGVGWWVGELVGLWCVVW